MRKKSHGLADSLLSHALPEASSALPLYQAQEPRKVSGPVMAPG